MQSGLEWGSAWFYQHNSDDKMLRWKLEKGHTWRKQGDVGYIGTTQFHWQDVGGSWGRYEGRGPLWEGLRSLDSWKIHTDSDLQHNPDSGTSGAPLAPMILPPLLISLYNPGKAFCKIQLTIKKWCCSVRSMCEVVSFMISIYYLWVTCF